jgi:hypothetical protein
MKKNANDEKSNLYIDHVAILVTSIEEFGKRLPQWLHPQEIEEFEAEGTREQYVLPESSYSGALLLMQPNGEGPYQRAMQKRGPGLHHICIKVKKLSEYLSSIAQSGFLLHPYSLESMKRGTAYLCRPGIGFLLEVEELSRNSDSLKPSIIERITLELGKKELEICRNILGEKIVAGPSSFLSLTPDKKNLNFV